jgi:hypothetical protein
MGGATALKCCPTCGQTLPPADLAKGSRLTFYEERMLDLLRKAGQRGICVRDLVDLVYETAADGGPEYASRCIWQFKRGINTKLIGWRIASSRGPSARYWLEVI